MKKLLKRAVCDRCETTFSLFRRRESVTARTIYRVEAHAAERHLGSADWLDHEDYDEALNTWLNWAACDCCAEG